MTARRLRAALGLLLFLGGPLATPVLDGLLFHREVATPGPHVESAEADCHGERCILGVHAVPALPVVPVAAPRAVPGPGAAAEAPPPASHRPSRRHDPATAPRAPPHRA